LGINSNKQRTRVVLALVLAAAALAPAAAGAKEISAPVGVFVEGGVSDDSRSVVVGAAWTWVQPSKWGAGNASGYLETSVGEWACHREEGARYRHCSVQFGLTPVLRYEPSWWEHWYMELGVGADVVAPAWHTDKRRFSTDFNFGDHIGLGRKFGADGADEIELRAEHYSNGGIKHPNPGENWFQLRYMHWFK
jgi:lipid A 3-O-deacylase